MDIKKIIHKTNQKLYHRQHRKNICKECRGSSICEHQRQRSTCKECGGASICQHQRQRSKCKECKNKCLINQNNNEYISDEYEIKYENICDEYVFSDEYINNLHMRHV